MRTAENIDYKRLYEQAQLKMEALQRELNQLKKLLFGSKQERFIPDDVPGQPVQGTLDLPVEVREVCKISEAATVTVVRAHTEIITARKDHPGRQKLPDHLRREVIVLEPEGDISGMKRMGFEITEVLEFTPGELYVKQFVRPIYLKTAGALNSVFVTASLPGRLMEKCMAGESLLAQMVVDKYMDHLPVHRQLQRMQRAGVTISQSTSNDWMRNTLMSLTGLYEVHKKEILQSSYLHVDETTIKVQDEDKKGKAHLGYYWVYHNCEKKIALFDYRPGRGRDGPVEILKDFTGYIQTDGYGVYDDFGKKPGITLLHCMAHARCKFTEALNNDAARAKHVLERIQVLYAIERKIHKEGLQKDEILQLRQSQAVPVLKELKEWMLAQVTEKHQLAMSSAIGQALSYSLARWDKLSIYTTDARLQIDNNPVENAIRPVAVGRKNYLFAGSHDAAQRAAMIYSLFATCRMHKINPYIWLKDILQRMHTYSTVNIHELLPQNWKMAMEKTQASGTEGG